jgi:hypothetical protein
MIKKMVTPALFLLLLMSLCGCTAGLAMQGLSSGAPVAFNATGSGKGDSAWYAHYDDVVQAALRAGEKLSFQLKKKNTGKDRSDFNFVDDRGAKLEILIVRRTATLTWARFNVGLFGSTSIGRLMARQIIVEVAEADDFLRDWHPTEDDD